jgi:hypothetical protein
MALAYLLVGIEAMLRPIMKEFWTRGSDAKRVRTEGPVAAADGWECAYERAKQLSSAFSEHGFEHTEECSYAWGFDADSQLIVRFVVR